MYMMKEKSNQLGNPLKRKDFVRLGESIKFYPGIIDRVREHGLFISANTDVHESSTLDFNSHGFMRPITLIFAEERTEQGIRESLESCRTLAFGFNMVCGDEQLLKDFFTASVKVNKLSESAFMLTNQTSVPYTIQQEGKNPVSLPPLSTIRLEGECKITILNMLCGKDVHPQVELSF